MSESMWLRAILTSCLAAILMVAPRPSLADQPPVAADDRVVVRGTSFVLVDVLANDSDADGDPLTATATGGAAVTNVGDGLFLFQPTHCLQVPQSFTYQVDDGSASTLATVHLEPGGCDGNLTPLALPDARWTPPDTPVVVDVLENDSDPDGDPLCVFEVDQMVHGSAEISGDCLTVSFSPDPGYTGDGASFRYRVQDGRGGAAEAPVSITVDTDPSNPDLPADLFATEMSKVLILPSAVLMGNDGTGLSFGDAFSAVGDAVDVVWPPGGDPTVLYHPPPGFLGTRAFTYSAFDGTGVEHFGEVTVRIVTPVGTMRAQDDYLDARADGCLVADFEDLTANDQGGGLGIDSYGLLAQPLVGSLVVVPSSDGLVVSYSAPPGYTGKDAFTYVVEDELMNADVAAVVLDVRDGASAPHRPVAAADSVRVTGATNPPYLQIPVLTNDYDPDCGGLAVSIETGPSLGTVSVQGDGTLRYVPFPDATGADALTYRVMDPEGETDTATASVYLVEEVPAPWPRFWYRSCETLETCIVDGRDSRRGDGTYFPLGPNLCNLAWTFEGATPPPGDFPSCVGGVPAPVQALDDYYSEPGLHWVDLTLWHFDHRVVAGRWVPVGGTLHLPSPPFDFECELAVCTFTPRGNYLDGTIDRFEWFFDAATPTGGPDLITTSSEPVDHTFAGGNPGDVRRVWLVFYPFEGSPSGRAVDVVLPGPPPEAPGDLAIGPDTLPCHLSGPRLVWQDLSDDETGFRVYRSVAGGPFVLRAELGAGSTEYGDHYVGPAQDVLAYQVASFNPFGESPSGPVDGQRRFILCEAPVDALPPMPSDLVANGPVAGGVSLSWSDTSANEEGFRVYREENGQTSSQVGAVGADVTSWDDSGLVPGVDYTYRVAAYNATGGGEPSAPASFHLADGIFSDGFETADTAAWVSTGGSGLAVSSPAALFGNFGLAVELEGGGSSFLVDDSPAEEPRYRVRFVLDPTGLDTSGVGPGAGEVLTLLEGRSEAGSLPVFALQLFPSLGGRLVMEGVAYRIDGATSSTPRAQLPLRPAAIEMEWWQGASDGGLRLWIDGSLAGETIGVPNQELSIDEVRLGALGIASGAAGELVLDEFSSRRASLIGREDLAGELGGDDFEDGELLLWEPVTGAGGSVAATPQAALSGELGVRIALAPGQLAYLERYLRASESHLLARFLVDGRGLSLGLGNEVRLLSGTVPGAPVPTFSLQLRMQGTDLSAVASAQLDSGDRSETAGLPLLTTGTSLVEVGWRAASLEAGGGYLLLRVEEVASGSSALAEALSLENSTQRVEILRLGQDVASGAATEGSVDLDRVEVWR